MINVAQKNKVRDITAIGLMVALLCISSYIAFPIPFTPIMLTSQTIIINLIAITMNTKNGVLSIIVFYLIGAIGLPVFSGGRSGVGTLVGPSGGYFLIAITMNTKNGVLSIIVFYLIGAIGLPVFSGGRSGVGTLVGPSGGYFLGFLLTVLVITLIKGKNLNLKKSIILTVFVGMTMIYICGAAWMGYYNGLSFMENLKVSILPFIPGDLIKCVLASFIGVRINKIYGVGNE